VLLGTVLGMAAQARVVCRDTRNPGAGGPPQPQIAARHLGDAQLESCAGGPAAEASSSARANYVFVTRARRALGDLSLDDPRLRRLTIGVVAAEDVAYSPPAAALAAHGLARNVRTFRLDTESPSTRQAAIVEAVASGDVDVALVWRPLAEHLAARSRVPLRLQPVADQDPVAGRRATDAPRRSPDAHAVSDAASDGANQGTPGQRASRRAAPEGRDDAGAVAPTRVDSRPVGL
jgi:hypothetical protein